MNRNLSVSAVLMASEMCVQPLLSWNLHSDSIPPSVHMARGRPNSQKALFKKRFGRSRCTPFNSRLVWIIRGFYPLYPRTFPTQTICRSDPLPATSNSTSWVRWFFFHIPDIILRDNVVIPETHITRSRSRQNLTRAGSLCKCLPSVPEVQVSLTKFPRQLSPERASPYIYPAPGPDTLPALHEPYQPQSRYDHAYSNSSSHHSRQPGSTAYRSYSHHEPVNQWHAPPTTIDPYVRTSFSFFLGRH